MATANDMQAVSALSYLSNGASYLEDLYESYLINPNNVAPEWQTFFSQLPAINGKNNGLRDQAHAPVREFFIDLARRPNALAQSAAVPQNEKELVAQFKKQIAVQNLIAAYRAHGHHRANLDPLNLAQRKTVADLDPAYHNLTKDDFNKVFETNLINLPSANLQSIIDRVQKIYCGNIGLEYMHITNTEEVSWLQQQFEIHAGDYAISQDDKKYILNRLTAAEGLEKYLGAKFVGQKRFSLEGGDSLIPLLDMLIHESTKYKVNEVSIGMAHRGRLNVLVNLLGKAPEELFKEFEGKALEQERSGDVKYHQGFSCDLTLPSGSVHIALAFNPSHLEIVSPVVGGAVRAKQQRRNDTIGAQVIPISIHGDAAFAGQGVVMETFSMSQARGFTTGGTVHIVVNNQIGFTTSDPLDARSTFYCTEVAKMVQAPIFHVNADDPEAVVFVARLAAAFRTVFKKDVMIDLVCYRRHGHNEADEPSATQPLMYQAIKAHPTARQIYADRLIAEGIYDAAAVDALSEAYRQKLDAGQPVAEYLAKTPFHAFSVDWAPYQGNNWDMAVNTQIDLTEMKSLATQLEKLPAEFVLQAQVQKLMQDRVLMTKGEIPVNWGYAEVLAYATLVRNGIPVRFSGQDCCRGTFAHRHAVLHDQKTDATYTPLHHVDPKQAQFLIIDSVLSEEAVLAFEYGYSSADPKTLTIWEAQFGDFANGAQVVIDQFISSGEQKWGRYCGLVMLLPHGFEGQGPEHSSARLERYLQLCAQNNMQVCVPSTPAQIFHLLRRQAIRPYRKPLVVMSPKSLLRHKLAVSTLTDLAQGQFYPVIGEQDELANKSVTRLILCSGKVYYDLLEARRAAKRQDVAIIRIEQLYPFPEKLMQAEMKRYPAVKKVIWCQEEPQNQGAWYSSMHHFSECLMNGQSLEYAGRPASASPAVGAYSLHVAQQQALVAQALG